nr:hypothetical protein [uncultured Anaerocolumna sp.]
MYSILLFLTEANAELPNIINTEFVKILVPAIISILGYFVTTLTISKNFKNELSKQKSNLHIEKMSTIPYKVLMLLEGIQDNSLKEDELLSEIKILINTIYSYGSKEAIELVSLMQKENYAMAIETGTVNKYRLMSFYVLLATQIKYDVTGILVSPNLWFQMKLVNYQDVKEKIKEANNKLVDELELNKKFKIE